MATSTFDGIHGLLTGATLFFTLASLAIVGWYLYERPSHNLTTKLFLLLGIFVFPVLAAGSGNLAGFETTKRRAFCGGCHVMVPYTEDAGDPSSRSLAAMHGRNRLFGAESCYSCHKDYSMFGTVTTKLDGLVHAYHYYGHYRSMPVERALEGLHLYRPFPNDNCTQCHSMEIPGFMELEDHAGIGSELRAREASCVGSGCHGPAHPFSKQARRAERGGEP
jgi:cytochrome c-type protein NapC